MSEPTGGRRQPDDGLDERLDELEQKVLGRRADQTRDEETDESPAFDQDVVDDDRRDAGSGSEPP
ncbi:MAG: hypothetical protein M3235_14680 [Actinomycetota bacterium]|nr:hypothetical protein [Actinomycetota bacterium]